MSGPFCLYLIFLLTSTQMCGSILLMEELTPKQEKVLKFIRERIEGGLAPTIREIGGELGVRSTGTVRDYLKALAQKGYLKRKSKLSRAIELFDMPKRGIPVLGVIPAGRPSEAYEHIQGYINPDDLFLGRLSMNDVFALRVKGESMIEAGINDGDIAVLKKQKTADNGAIIAALLEDNEVTLKKLKQKGREIFLEAANRNYPPIHKEFSIIGKLITIIRKY